MQNLSRPSPGSESAVAAANRRLQSLQSAKSGVKTSSSALYDRKWRQFCDFSKDSNIQQGNGTLDPEGPSEPSADVVGKILEFYHYKVEEKKCNPGEVVNIRSALVSVYKRRFSRIGEWKVSPDGSTEGSPMNSIVLTEAMLFYKREKKSVGYNRALPFRYKYMVKLERYAKEKGLNSLFSSYVMAAAALCFTLWLRIDELVNLNWSSMEMNSSNDKSVPLIMARLKERKYLRNDDGQQYALYKLDEEPSACAFSYLHAWIKVYRAKLGREFMVEDPLFPRADEKISKLDFGERMIQQRFMKTLNSAIKDCGIIVRNVSGQDLGRFTSHCFRRGGAQHRFVTGKTRWPLDVVKWWGGWGKGDDVNTIIRYLLEETSRYEQNFTHYLYTKGSDARIFNNNATTTEDIGRELTALTTTLTSRLGQMAQSAAAHRLLVSSELTSAVRKLENSIEDAVKKIDDCINTSMRETKRDNAARNQDPLCNTEATEMLIRSKEYGSNQPSAGDTAEDCNNILNTCLHIPRIRVWREAISHWHEGCPEKNLTVPLKNWPKRARTSSLKSKYHDRKIIAEKFIELGEEAFIATYKPDDVTLTKLKELIRKDRAPIADGP